MITTSLGAKRIEGTDNWREIFDAHNNSVTSHEEAIAKQYIRVRVNITTTLGTKTVTVAGLTANHVLDSMQFFTDAFTTPTGDRLAAFDWTTDTAGTLTLVTTAVSQACYVELGFAYKPNVVTNTELT